ncbi:hypothetical protein FDO65_06860 [Nakamurella flava]|uniref:YopA central domain-containing protein n=1 Tax=Nakamurella flava TaxID=2576308 RepID=A0A4U6QL88_9ACTN|nr:hypothetical protein [Nakamurella flava]TKV61317.1 hypothetical protein FDO65_06860 [Nakamurella flava]
MDEEQQFPAPLVHPLGWPAPGTSTTVYRGPLLGVMPDGAEVTFPGELALTWELKPLATWSPADPNLDARLIDDVPGPAGGTEFLTANSPMPLDHPGESRVRNLRAHTQLGDGADLDRVVFFLGTGLQSARWDRIQSPDDPHPVRGRLTIPFAEWIITIDQSSDEAMFKRLRRQNGGWAFTHLCEIVRADGANFDASVALPIVQGIATAFTFTVGREINAALTTGTYKGEIRWAYFGKPGFTGWSTPWSWSDTQRDAEQLRELLPLWLAKWRDPDHRHTLSLAAGYHFVANRTEPVDSGLATAISALLLLAEHTDPGQFAADPSVSQQVRSFLSRCSIDVQPRPNYPELEKAGIDYFAAELAKPRSGKKPWLKVPPDSVDSVVYARNVVVHPKARERSTVANRVWHQAWALSTEWLTLGILHWLGYTGTYASRTLAGVRWHGAVEQVPWAP